MHRAEDYLDLTKADISYLSEKEHRNDYIAFFDLILENYIAARTESPGKYYTPGTILTDAQANIYYGKGYSDRPLDTYSEEIAHELTVAKDHILSREKATGDKLILPIKTVRDEYKLSLLEELAVLMPLALDLDINHRNLYAYIANDALLKNATVGTLYALYAFICPDADISLFNELCDRYSVMSVCFFKTPVANPPSLMDTPLALRSDILSYLLGKDNVTPIPYVEEYDISPIDIDVFSDLKDTFPVKDDGSFIYVESMDNSDVLQLLAQCGRNDILVLHADRLYKDINKKGMPSGYDNPAIKLGGLFNRIRIKGGTIAIKIRNGTDEDYICRLMTGFRKYLPDKIIYIYGEERMPEFMLSDPREVYQVKLEYPDVDSREKLWNYYLKNTGLKLSKDISISDLADCYELSLSGIDRIVSQLKKQAVWSGKKSIDKKDLKDRLFSLGEAGLKSLATYIPSSYTWDDLQIEPGQRSVLITACDRFRYRNRIARKLWLQKRAAYGNGVSILLCGPPGTGKTMAAQVISEELQLPLYRIDVSQIYSKYLGETQKNLGEVFDQAQKTNVILFFDEADALFSKRTEVSDAHDKYANAETAYLLQKIEAHSGIVLLATNLFQNFDSAFVRRLTYVVKFYKPEVETRLALWKSILPDTMDVSPDVNYEFFAENFDIPGSTIKSILYSAMYMASAQNRELTNRDIVLAIKYEFEKTGGIHDTSQFGPYMSYLFE
ncbi:MAG: AAA family ATPase [Lachnospiraceae bacterium]|nr:AAA family ATPase [Lachnospiraceae bacterium]